MDPADLSHLPDCEREEMASETVAAEARTPFDLANGPLFRCRLIRLGQDDHVMVITVHHTVFDGWSIGVFWREFVGLYDAFRSGSASPLPDLPVQYADFSAWQRRCLDGPVRESHMAYWLRQLEGNLPTLDLPTDRPRQDQRGRRGAQKTLRIDSRLGQSLKALAHQEAPLST